MIRFQNVGLRYGLGEEVLRDITFHLAPGSFTVLTGPSGAGKSSLLRLMYLGHRPSRGLVTLFDTDISLVPRHRLYLLRRQIGVVFQEFRLLDQLDVLENVALPLRISGHGPDHYRDNVIELLEWVGLGKRIHAKPSTLSGGEKQRVAIARAVVNRPRLILADEPTGNVDPEMSARLMRLFVELNKLGTAVVIATHNVELERPPHAQAMELKGGGLSMLSAEALG